MITRHITIILVTIGFMALATAGASGQVLYVDDDALPGGDGLSWTTAYRFLQDALAHASASSGTVTEIHVGQGVYTPDRDEANPDGISDCCATHGGPGCNEPACEVAVCAVLPLCCSAEWDASCVALAGELCEPLCADARQATFQLVNGVTLAGGYAGPGTPDPDARDVDTYPSVLSGDLFGNDGPGSFENNQENAYNVVTGSGTDLTTGLDGFTITAGNADGPDGSPFNWQRGAGMWNSTGSPTVQDCVFHANHALLQGGGMANYYGSSPTVADCTFSDNVATDGNGGGMRNFDNSSPTVTGCTFIGNSSGAAGGGMISSNPCTPTVIGCTFSGNYALWGGGMENAEGAESTITDCTFSGNTAEYAGGGVHNINSSPDLINCQFIGNQYMIPSGGGGSMINITGTTTLTNCLFAGNQGAWGAGLLNWEGGDATLTNCTIVGNVAFSGGGGISNGSNSHPILNNCIIWDNVGEEIRNDPTSSATVAYSNIEGGYPGTGNINLGPSFVSPGGGDYRLSGGSPCIDAASNPAVPVGVTTDLDGTPRFLDDPCRPDCHQAPGTCGGSPIVEMGAYEFQ
ncbi:MAG: right-handed parallel beta-helix repeat-containing protein, partial [Planctomycetota bacterium]